MRISGNIDIISPKGVFVYEGTEFGAGKQVVNNLKRSELFALYICTAGEEVSRRSKELMSSGNLLEGYVTDMVGSLLVKGAMDILHEGLQNEMELKGLKITNRYSPGYCEWNVDEQHKLFSFFPEGFCGVRLSESALMKPIKSVSGVIGIGKEVRFNKYICNACSSVSCIYRNIKYAYIHGAGRISSADVPWGTMLLDAVRSSGFGVYSPCGGNGTCGKCKVYVKHEGYVTSFHFIRLSTGSLIETHTALNPQAKYGADVISRINYCILNQGGLHTLQSELIDSVNSQLAHFTAKPEITPDDIVKVSICGNTTMLHILLGVNPQPLAFVPFTPAFTEENILKASELNLDCNPRGEVKVLPSLSAYIGADIVAGIASLAPVPAHTNFLFIDVGTNGEIALITPDRIYCCAAAAGPAFEGANIEHGMGALQGAINIYYGPGNFQTIGDTEPLGICGSGLIDLVASLLGSGYVSTDGYLEQNFVMVPSRESGTGQDIYISPKDIREIQLAKSAIASGIKILVQRAGLTLSDIDALYLAGGFGNYIRTESAVATGLIPYELSGKVIPVGNTSGTGAMLAVRSVLFDKAVSETLNRMSYIELSDDDGFVLQFALNMEFPYLSDLS